MGLLPGTLGILLGKNDEKCDCVNLTYGGFLK